LGDHRGHPFPTAKRIAIRIQVRHREQGSENREQGTGFGLFPLKKAEFWIKNEAKRLFMFIDKIMGRNCKLLNMS
jgi:hypothetical protein